MIPEARRHPALAVFPKAHRVFAPLPGRCFVLLPLAVGRGAGCERMINDSKDSKKEGRQNLVAREADAPP